jgi:hypothetical protein
MGGGVGVENGVKYFGNQRKEGQLIDSLGV